MKNGLQGCGCQQPATPCATPCQCRERMLSLLALALVTAGAVAGALCVARYWSESGRFRFDE